MIKSEQLTLNVVKLSTLKAFLIERGMNAESAEALLTEVLDPVYTWGTSAHTLVDLCVFLSEDAAELPTKVDNGDVIVEVRSLIRALEELYASADEPLFLDLEN